MSFLCENLVCLPELGTLRRWGPARPVPRVVGSEESVGSYWWRFSTASSALGSPACTPHASTQPDELLSGVPWMRLEFKPTCGHPFRAMPASWSLLPSSPISAGPGSAAGAHFHLQCFLHLLALEMLREALRYWWGRHFLGVKS